MDKNQDDFEKVYKKYLTRIKRIAFFEYHAGLSMTYEDLEQIGAEAFYLAWLRYDPSLAKDLWQYAQFRVRGAMRDAIREIGFLSRPCVEGQQRVTLFKADFEREHHRTPTVDEIQKGLGLSSALMQRFVYSPTYQPVLSGDLSVAEYGEDIEEKPWERDEDAPSPEAKTADWEKAEILERAIQALPYRIQHVVREYHYAGRSLGKIGEDLGMSESGASLRRKRGLELLREWLLERYNLEDLLDGD